MNEENEELVDFVQKETRFWWRFNNPLIKKQIRSLSVDILRNVSYEDLVGEEGDEDGSEEEEEGNPYE